MTKLTREERAEAMVERMGAALQELIDGFEIRGDDALDTLISDWQSMPSHVTNPLDSQGIVTRNGGEG